VEELLVVTFTEAATEELRGRIRSNIHELRIACLRESTDNPLYSALLAEIADKTRRRRRCCWLNGRWTKRRYLPFTAFASGC
jgi:ATP-dependent exoDNAse (exonuclease V) beta subunit